MSEIAIVFGGSGFIGTHLIRMLVQDRAHQVISADLLPPRERLQGVEYRTADVRDLSSFSVSSPISTIYNLAAVHTTPGHLDHEYYEANIGGALEITRFAVRHGVSEIVFTSSISVYGPGEETKTEESLLAPASAYGYSKMLAERVYRHWLDGGESRRLVIVRPAVVFGPGERGNFTRLAALLKKGWFIYPGRRDTIKACIYIDDLIETIAFAKGQPERFVLFNGAYPQRYSLEQIVNCFAKQHFPNARTIVMPRQVVSLAAALLGAVNIFEIGIHRERVMKLVRSTDVYPVWLRSHGREFPNALETALARWSAATSGKFD